MQQSTTQRYVINASFHCLRDKQDSLIRVMNADSYLMAEYSANTGVAKWQRVVAVAQRDSVERWLNEHFPVQKSAAARAASR
ncbi:MAG: hypothetical protein ABI823_17750 [Bryobacteraceae bacterium]